MNVNNELFIPPCTVSRMWTCCFGLDSFVDVCLSLGADSFILILITVYTRKQTFHVQKDQSDRWKDNRVYQCVLFPRSAGVRCWIFLKGNHTDRLSKLFAFFLLSLRHNRALSVLLGMSPSRAGALWRPQVNCFSPAAEISRDLWQI